MSEHRLPGHFTLDHHVPHEVATFQVHPIFRHTFKHHITFVILFHPYPHTVDNPRDIPILVGIFKAHAGHKSPCQGDMWWQRAGGAAVETIRSWVWSENGHFTLW